MIEMLIVAAIVAKLGLDSAGKFAVDVGFGVRGKASPRLAEARARRPRGAASNYFSELWDDVWTDASRKRAARRERSSSPSRPRGAARIYLSNLWRDGWDGAERRRQEKATRPRPGQQTVPGTVVPNAQDGERPRPAPVPDEDETAPQDERPEFDGDGIRLCSSCGERLATFGTVCPSCMNGQDEPNPGPESVPDFDPSPATPTTEGPTTMSTATGEVTGLDTAIRFCEDSARGYEAQIHQIELAKASLTTAEATAVAGPLASAMEMTEAAARAMKQAEAELRKQIPIAELYRANPGAATKDFMLQG